jgi:hypothetical protein
MIHSRSQRIRARLAAPSTNQSKTRVYQARVRSYLKVRAHSGGFASLSRTLPGLSASLVRKCAIKWDFDLTVVRRQQHSGACWRLHADASLLSARGAGSNLSHRHPCTAHDEDAPPLLLPRCAGAAPKLPTWQQHLRQKTHASSVQVHHGPSSRLSRCQIQPRMWTSPRAAASLSCSSLASTRTACL